MELDEVLASLGEVQDQLLALESDDFAERFRLQTEQDRLRALAEEIRGSMDPFEGRSDHELEAEAESLRAQMKTTATRTGGIVTSKGGGSQSPASGEMAALQIQAQQQQGSAMARFAARLNDIEAELARRRKAKQPG